MAKQLTLYHENSTQPIRVQPQSVESLKLQGWTENAPEQKIEKTSQHRRTKKPTADE